MAPPTRREVTFGLGATLLPVIALGRHGRSGGFIPQPASPPTYSPGAGTYATAQNVALASTTPSATIYYTLDGSTPTTASPVYSGPILVNVNETITAIAISATSTQSPVSSAAYVISTAAAATPTASPAGGTYSVGQSVVLSDTTPSSTIYYTEDGSTPTTSSAVYSTAISVSASLTLKFMATAPGYVQSSVGSATYAIGVTGFLATGHYVPHKLALNTVYPRPDSETSAYARHHWAYYDGTNAVEYRIPIGVQFGAPPYVFELIAGPSWLSIPYPAWIPGNTAQQMLALGYGDVVGTPTAAITSPVTVTVRVYSQDYQTDPTQYIDVTWTLKTSSSTAQFIFVDPVNGVDTNAGTISAPFKTLPRVFGATSGTVTFPGSNVYLRTGTHAAYQMSTTQGIVPNANNTPVCIMGFPGESPAISIAGAGSLDVFNFASSSQDPFFQNFSFDSSVTPPGATGNFRYFESDFYLNRMTWHNISAPNVFAGGVSGGNSSSIEFQDPGGTSLRDYIYIKGYSETNRPNSSNQSYGICDLYVSNYVLIEFCAPTNSSAVKTMYMKASCLNTCRRFNYCTNTGGGVPMGANDQINRTGVLCGPHEICYNVVYGTYLRGITAEENLQANSCTNYYCYRNTIVGASYWIGDSTGCGPFSLEYDVIQWSPQAAAVYYNVLNVGTVDTLPLPASITNTGTECQAASGVVDASYNLTGSYATNYLYTRGAQIG